MKIIRQQIYGKSYVKMAVENGRYTVHCHTEGSKDTKNKACALANQWIKEAKGLNATPKTAPKAVPVVTTTQLQNTVELQAKEMSELRAEIRKLQEQQKNDAADKQNLQNQIDRLNAKLDRLIQVLVNRR